MPAAVDEEGDDGEGVATSRRRLRALEDEDERVGSPGQADEANGRRSPRAPARSTHGGARICTTERRGGGRGGDWGGGWGLGWGGGVAGGFTPAGEPADDGHGGTARRGRPGWSPSHG